MKDPTGLSPYKSLLKKRRKRGCAVEGEKKTRREEKEEPTLGRRSGLSIQVNAPVARLALPNSEDDAKPEERREGKRGSFKENAGKIDRGKKKDLYGERHRRWRQGD